VFEKVGDVLAEFGFQKEADEKKRSRPAESTESSSKKTKTAEPKAETQNEQSP
jgi:hypothetical protein